LAASGESGKASDLAVARATGRDNVLSLFSVRRRLAAMAVSASALLRAPEASLAAAARLAKGLCSTGDGDRGPKCEGAPRELSSIPRLTAVAMVVLAVGAVAEEEEAMASVCRESCKASAKVLSRLGEPDRPDMAGPANAMCFHEFRSSVILPKINWWVF